MAASGWRLVVLASLWGLAGAAWAQRLPHQLKRVEFGEEGRPADAFVLNYARDEALCATFLAGMNEPHPGLRQAAPGSDHRLMWNEMFLGSRFSVNWVIKGGDNAWLADVDLDNNGVVDHVYHQSWMIRGVEHDAMSYTPDPPLDPADPLASLLAAKRVAPVIADGLGRRSAMDVILDDRTVDFGGGEPVTDRSGWNFGQFWNVAVVFGRAYLVTGGNGRKLVGREWFPVRLTEVQAPDGHRVMCELLPKYRQAYIEDDEAN